MSTDQVISLLYKVLVVCIISLLLYSCKNEEVSQTSFHTQEIHQLENKYNFHVIEMDGCHYLLLEVDRNNPHEGFGFFSHRGNCPNPIHYERTEVLKLYPPSREDVLEGIPLRRSTKK